MLLDMNELCLLLLVAPTLPRGLIKSLLEERLLVRLLLLNVLNRLDVLLVLLPLELLLLRGLKNLLLLNHDIRGCISLNRPPTNNTRALIRRSGLLTWNLLLMQCHSVISSLPNHYLVLR